MSPLSPKPFQNAVNMVFYRGEFDPQLLCDLFVREAVPMT